MKNALLAGCVSVSMLSLGALALAGEKDGVKHAAATQNGATPDSKMAIERQKIKTDKKFVVSENMDLTDAEAKSFWPIYDAYQKDLEKINQRIASLVTAYMDANANDTFTNELARKSVAEYLAIESAELEAKRAMLAKVGKVLPPQKVARYAQVENKIRALVKYELAANIPLGA